jgi:hypothetical protein
MTVVADYVDFSNGELSQGKDLASAFYATETTFADGLVGDGGAWIFDIGNLDWDGVSYNNTFKWHSRWDKAHGAVISLTDCTGTTGRLLDGNTYGRYYTLVSDNCQFSFGGDWLNTPAAGETGEIRLLNGSYWIGDHWRSFQVGTGAGDVILEIRDSTLKKAKANVVVGPNTTLITDNATIIQDAADSDYNNIDIQITDPTQFDGDGLTIQSENSGPWRRHPVFVEIGGEDLGPWSTGFTVNSGNFSISRLALNVPRYDPVSYADTVTRLVDNRDNISGGGSEALYVHTVELLRDSRLDLNGLNLYYVELVDNGFTLEIEDSTGGGSFQQVQDVPCPCDDVTAAFLAAACAAFEADPPTSTAQASQMAAPLLDAALTSFDCDLDDPCRDEILALIGLQ